MLYPINTLLTKNIIVAGGSDCPMESLHPLAAIQTATKRTPPKERITIDDALRLYTVNAAYITHEENVKGLLAEDKLADLIVLSSDPTSINPEKLSSIEVELTITGGKITHQKKT